MSVIKVANPVICVEFADDGSIFYGKTLLHVGHSSDLVWYAFVGRVAYLCVVNVCTSFETMPPYQIMEHLMN